MNSKTLILGQYYKHRNSPNIGYAKAIEIIKSKTGLNTNTFQIVKCEWVVNKNDTFGLIKYFRLSDLIK